MIEGTNLLYRFAKKAFKVTTITVVLSASYLAHSFENTLRSVEFTNMTGDKPKIMFYHDKDVLLQPTNYTIDSPAKIVIDLNGVKNALKKNYFQLGIGNARELAVMEGEDRTRAVISLGKLTGKKVFVRGHIVEVVLGEGLPGGTSSDDGTVLPESPRDGEGVGKSVIKDIDFKRTKEEAGELRLQFSDHSAEVSVTNEGDEILVKVSDSFLAKDLHRRLDVTDFKTPVKEIQAFQEGKTTIFSITTNQSFEYFSYQADDILIVRVSPKFINNIEGEEGRGFRYDGEKISLNFQDIKVRTVLQLVAKFTGFNLVASDSVSGNITIVLNNVPWDQALDLILETRGLDKRRAGNVLRIAPADEIANLERQQLENKRQLAELATLHTKFIQIKYANAADLSSIFSSGGGSDGSNSILSDRGSVIVDERTNSVIVTDTLDNLNEIRDVIANLDVPVRQVLIEARVVTASSSFSEQLGVRWGAGYRNGDSGSGLAFSSSIDGVSTIRDGISNSISDSYDSASALIVDLGAPAAGSFGVGLWQEDYLLDLELSASQNDGDAQVIARPKVITADKKSASIESGVEIPYQEASSSGATSTAFKNAVLSLQVTPQITPDDRIIMDLIVSQDTVGELFNGVPSINTNSIDTQVLIENGQTVVLGGIFQISKSSGVQKTPLLAELPFVGQFFKVSADRDNKQELLIFITPRILDESIASR